MAAIVLLLFSALALLERHTQVQVGVIAPALLGVLVLVLALLQRRPAWLIPAGVLLGAGAGVLAGRFVSAGVTVDQALFLLCLGGGFALITAFSQFAFRQKVRWPLIPAGVLAALGLLHLAGAEARQGWRLFQQVWPFLALSLAAWLYFTPGRRR